MMKENWSQCTVAETIRKLGSDGKNGLGHRHVRKNLKRDGENIIYPISKASFYDALRVALMDYTTILLLITAVVASIFDADHTSMLLAVLVVIHVAVTIAVYAKSQSILESMEHYSLPVSRVIRNGRLYMVAQKKLVRGDLVFLSEGDIVPADIRLIATDRFVTQEDNLFDTKTLTPKDAKATYQFPPPPEGQTNMAFASTLVVGGDASGIIIETGGDALVSSLSKNKPIITHEQIPVIRVLAKYSRIWSLCMIGIVFFLTVLEFLSGNDASLFRSFLTGLSFAVSSMSEMLVPFASIVIACGIYSGVRRYRDVNSGFIIKKPAAIEKLKDITCLVVPREGVFTTKEFTAELVCTANHTYKIADTRAKSKIDRVTTMALLSTGQYSSGVLSDKEQYARRTAEDISIIAMAKRLHIYNAALDQVYPLTDHIKKGRNVHFDTTLVRQGSELLAVMRGTPMEILSRCESYVTGGDIRPLDQKTRNRLVSIYQKMARQSFHIIAVATKKSIYNNLRFPNALHQNMVFEGFVAFRIPFLRGVVQTVRHCQSASIRPIFISEHGEDEDFCFAMHIGIIQNRKEVMTAVNYRSMSSDIKRKTAAYYKMYCGLNSAEQCELIQNLQANGEKVGYLGHELVDLQMMRQSNATFAQNITISSRAKNSVIPIQGDLVTASSAEIFSHNGCEALKFTSDVIISDADLKGNGGFNAIVDALAFSKLIDRNMINMIRYLITAQVARLGMVLYSVLSGTGLISPIQVIFAGLITDFLAVMIFAFERPEEEILYHRPSSVERLKHPWREFRYAGTYGILWALFCVAISRLPLLFGIRMTAAQGSTAAFVLSVLLQMMVLLCYKRDRWIFRRGARFSGIFILYLLSVVEVFSLMFLIPGFGAMFGVFRLSVAHWKLIGLFAIGFVPFCEVLKYLYHKKELLGIKAEEKRIQQRKAAQLKEQARKEKQEKAQAKREAREERRTRDGDLKNEETPKNRKLRRNDIVFSDVSQEIDRFGGHYIAGAESEDGRVRKTAPKTPKAPVGKLSLPHIEKIESDPMLQETKTVEFSDKETEILKHLFSVSDQATTPIPRVTSKTGESHENIDSVFPQAK